MNRRILLKGLGGAVVAAPFLPSLEERFARAAGTEADKPLRLCLFYTHNGCLTTKWFPKVSNGAITPDALAGTYLEGLSPYADRLLFPRGLKAFNSYMEIQTIDPHDQAMGSKLTCAPIMDDTNRYATSHSIDHEIARQRNPNGKPPLVLTVGQASTSIKDILSFSGPGEAYPAVSNPKTVYSDLTNLFTTGSTTPDDYKVLQGKSVVDLIKDDLNTLRRMNMSQKDQTRIDEWMALLDETGTGTIVPAACTEDTAGMLGVTAEAVDAASTGGGFGAGLTTAFTLGTDMMINLIALTMMCDANRSIIMTFPGYVKFNWDDIVHDVDHHGLSHRVGSAAVTGTCYPNVLAEIEKIDRWFASKYIKLVEKLAGIQEGDVPLLENTATVWLQELSDGAAHNTNNAPICIAGSLGGYLKQGMAINLESAGDLETGPSEAICGPDFDPAEEINVGFGTGSNKGNKPINKLYLNLMNGLGCVGEDGQKMTHWGMFDSKAGMTNKDTGEANITDPGEYAELLAGA